MEVFQAGTQYGDWKGTAAADGEHAISFEQYLESKGLTREGEFLIAVSFYSEHEFVYVRAFFYEGPQALEEVRKKLSKVKDPIPVRAVEVPLTVAEFFSKFKRFNVVLTWRGLQETIEGREYCEIEE